MEGERGAGGDCSGLGHVAAMCASGNRAVVAYAYSHSIVPGGFDV